MDNRTRKIVQFGILVLIDQAFKYLIRHQGGFYICNTGISFGIDISEVVLKLVYGVFVAVLFVFVFLKKDFGFDRFEKLGILLILSGAFSNLLDRIFFGCVIDFIDLHFWPVFNLADIFIVIGSGLFVWRIWKDHRDEIES